MAEVVHLFQAGLAPRNCEACGVDHNEPGALCWSCRSRQSAVPPVLVAQSVAGAIADLERANRGPAHVGDVMASVMGKLRSLYDAVGPRVLEAPGEVLYIEGEFWAVPKDSGVQAGPFPSYEAASDWMTERAADTVADCNEPTGAERRTPR